MERLEIALQLYCHTDSLVKLDWSDDHKKRIMKNCFTLADEFIQYNDSTSLTNFKEIADKWEIYIADTICSYFGIKREDINQICRESKFVNTRYFIWFWMKFFFPRYTLDTIGHIYGNKDHSNVTAGINKIKELLTSKDFVFTKVHSYFIVKFNPDIDKLNLFLEEKKIANWKGN